ncbi:oligopeptide/dipeptide ABC transporter ATP-binding protein [Seohaeicola zhoushanensis]
MQIQILLLLRELQKDFGMGVIFVTHDIGVAVEISERVAVMYAGQIVEEGTTREIIRDGRHPYTRGLLAANLHDVARGERLNAIPGAPPALETRPENCSFAPRCPLVEPACRAGLPPMRTPAPRRRVACVRAETPIAAE